MKKILHIAFLNNSRIIEQKCFYNGVQYNWGSYSNKIFMGYGQIQERKIIDKLAPIILSSDINYNSFKKRNEYTLLRSTHFIAFNINIHSSSILYSINNILQILK